MIIFCHYPSQTPPLPAAAAKPVSPRRLLSAFGSRKANRARVCSAVGGLKSAYNGEDGMDGDAGALLMPAHLRPTMPQGKCMFLLALFRQRRGLFFPELVSNWRRLVSVTKKTTTKQQVTQLSNTFLKGLQAAASLS